MTSVLQKFVGTINQRLQTIQDTVGRALPAIREPGQLLIPPSDHCAHVFDLQVPREIREVTQAHIEEFEDQRRVIEEAVPAYSVDELM